MRGEVRQNLLSSRSFHPATTRFHFTGATPHDAAPVHEAIVFCRLRCLTFCLTLLLFCTVAEERGVAQAPTVTAPAALTLHPGDSAVPLTVTLGSSTSSATYSITLTGLPSGVTATPLTMTPGSTATLLVSASRSAGIELFPAASYSDANTATVSAAVLAFAGTSQTQTSLALTISLSNPAYAPPASAINLPVLSIDTGGVAILDKVTDVPGTITIRSADGQTMYLPSSTLPDNTATCFACTVIPPC